MADSDWIELCSGVNVIQVAMIRSALEARGIEVFVQGEQHHAVLGPLGAAVRQRVLVRRAALPVARELASEIAGDLGPGVDDDGLRDDTYREPWVDEEDDSVEDDPEDRLTSKRKSLPIVLILASLGLAVGFAHMHASKPRFGALLLFVAIFSLGLIIGGRLEGVLLLLVVYAVDLIGGIVAVVQYNRRLDRTERSALTQSAAHS